MELPSILNFLRAYLPWILALSSIAFLCVNRYQTWSRLSHIPGPPSAAFSKFWLLRAFFSGDMHWRIKEVNEKYGKLLQLHLLLQNSCL